MFQLRHLLPPPIKKYHIAVVFSRQQYPVPANVLYANRYRIILSDLLGLVTPWYYEMGKMGYALADELVELRVVLHVIKYIVLYNYLFSTRHNFHHCIVAPFLRPLYNNSKLLTSKKNNGRFSVRELAINKYMFGNVYYAKFLYNESIIKMYSPRKSIRTSACNNISVTFYSKSKNTTCIRICCINRNICIYSRSKSCW